MSNNTYTLKLKVEDIDGPDQYDGDKRHCVTFRMDGPDVPKTKKKGMGELAFSGNMSGKYPGSSLRMYCDDSKDFHIGQDVTVTVDCGGEPKKG